jgi:hypothetical protein
VKLVGPFKVDAYRFQPNEDRKLLTSLIALASIAFGVCSVATRKSVQAIIVGANRTMSLKERRRSWISSACVPNEQTAR